MTAVNMSVKEMMKSKFGIDKIDVDPQVSKSKYMKVTNYKSDILRMFSNSKY